MSKWIRCIFCILGVLFACGGCSMGTKMENQTKEQKDTEELFLDDEGNKYRLSSEEIEGGSSSFDGLEKVEAALRGDEEQKELLEEILSCLRTYFHAEDSTEQENPLINEKYVYLSKQPLKYWDAIENRSADDDIELLVFSGDRKHHGLLSGSLEGGLNLTFRSEWEELAVMKQYPTEKFVLIHNMYKSGLLNQKNQYFFQQEGKYDASEMEIAGDVFDVLEKKDMAYSYQELTAGENLLRVEVK